jgi:hypothetical protein
LDTYVFRFLETDEGGIFVREIDNRGNPLQNKVVEFEKLGQRFPKGGNRRRKPTLVDLDADGKNELVFLLQSDYPYDPRGAACFDPISGKKLWEYYAGTKIENAVFHDLDHDGKKEIILTSFAANNGIEVNDTGDSYSFVIVLDWKGNVRWKRKVGAWHTYSRVTVSDVEGDGRSEIIAAAECGPARTNYRGKVFIFDAVTGERKHSFPSHAAGDISFSKPYVLKLSNTQSRIYVGDSSGRLLILDKNLALLKKIEENGPIHVLNTSPPSESRHYLYTRCGNRLLVYDWDLEKEVFTMDFDFEPPIEFIPLRSKEGRYALIKADSLYLVTESKASFGEMVKHWTHSGFLFTLIILLLFNGFFFYSVYRLKIPVFRYFRGTHTDVIEAPELYDIVEAIVHQAKNPISTILWTAEKIKRHSRGMNESKVRETYTQLADVLVENVNILKQHTHHISTLVRVHNPIFPEKEREKV